MTDNPFKTAEAWEPAVGGAILAAGNYELTIASADDGTSTGGYPQIELDLTNDDGHIRDWLVITPNSVGKIVALCNAAGVPVPEDEDVADRKTWRLKSEWLFRLVGRKVGAVLRDEHKYGSSDPNEMVTKVQGYVAPSRLSEISSDITPKGNGKPAPDLPF